MQFTRSIFCAVALSLLATSAFAADWQMTYYGPKKGTYFIDKDSVVDGGDGFKKYWVLFAPRVNVGVPGETFAYQKSLNGVNCQSRMATMIKSMYVDENGIERPVARIVREKNPYDIEPDTEEDFFWMYLCKNHSAKDLEGLGAPMSDSSMKQFLTDQVRQTKENNRMTTNR